MRYVCGHGSRPSPSDESASGTAETPSGETKEAAKEHADESSEAKEEL